MSSPSSDKNVLIIGASRGLGLAMAEEFLSRGYSVTATVRKHLNDSPIDELSKLYPERLKIETVDITLPKQVDALYDKLKNNRFEILFVNAGIKNKDTETIANVTTEEFNRVMLTNTLSPMRFIEQFRNLVSPNGTIGIMSSGLGSVSNNTEGYFEVYRSSKAALNTFMRSFAARHKDEHRTLLLTAPGWVKTDMGGDEAPLTINESIPSLVNVIEQYINKGGLHYIDYKGDVVPW